MWRNCTNVQQQPQQQQCHHRYQLQKIRLRQMALAQFAQQQLALLHLAYLRCDRIDVVGQLRRMRRQRAKLVQTLDQLIFCHEVLRHLVANGITRQPRTHFANYVRFLLSQRTQAGQRRIRAQFTDLLRCPH
ncbi:hypothetical protein niasHS_016446 [Heterodera schachtii]|uniref:Tyrosine-protein phosphatase domain-containing protein n=1 Tax=Heterodera schachtii TaxID=97005 RepID=A0ABD2HU13_HETSC